MPPGSPPSHESEKERGGRAVSTQKMREHSIMSVEGASPADARQLSKDGCACSLCSRAYGQAFARAGFILQPSSALA